MPDKRPRPPVEIRDAARADAGTLLSMIRALARHHGDSSDISLETIERDMFGEVPWVYTLVANMGHSLIGYAALCPLAQLQHGVRGIDMHHLFVDPQYRGAGVGRQLIRASMDKALSLTCSYMIVGTHPDNLDAQAFYLACGFDRCDRTHPRFRIPLRGK